MPKKFAYAEKLIALFQIAFGLICLYALIYGLYVFIDFARINNRISFKEISIYEIFKNYHLEIILNMVFILGGLLLFLQKKLGWHLTLIATILGLIFSLINIYKFIFIFQNSEKNKTAIILMIFSLIIISV